MAAGSELVEVIAHFRDIKGFLDPAAGGINSTTTDTKI
jgi:hypothetical protein